MGYDVDKSPYVLSVVPSDQICRCILWRKVVRSTYAMFFNVSCIILAIGKQKAKCYKYKWKNAISKANTRVRLLSYSCVVSSSTICVYDFVLYLCLNAPPLFNMAFAAHQSTPLFSYSVAT